METKKDHGIYKRTNEDKADACAWVFSSKNKIEKYFYKHPELKEDEVLIRITYSGVCMSDILTVSEKWGMVNYPLCPGHEIIGEVEKVGAECDGFKIGQKVMVGPFRNSCGNCELCKKGLSNYCVGMMPNEKDLYGKYWGGFSTHIQLNYNHVYNFPENLDEKTIAPLMCAGITTFLPINAHVKEGDKVGVIGCGGLGHFALQWAKLKNCQVDVFSSSHQNDDLIKKLGASEIIIWTEGEHLILQNQYDVLINTLPCVLDSFQFNSLLECLKPRGKLIQVGMPDVDSSLIVDPFLLVVKGLELIGSEVGGIKDYNDMFDYIKDHKVECLSEVFEWDDFEKAVNKIMNGKPTFRCVLNVDNYSKTFKKLD